MGKLSLLSYKQRREKMPRLNSTWRLEGEMQIGAEVWRNHHDIRQVTGTPLDTPPAPTADIVTAYVAFLTGLHYPDTTILSVTLREIWYKQGAPPHPEHPPVWLSTVNATGTGNTTFGGAHNANYLPKDAALFCKKVTTGAKPGKVYFRNVLTEVDVASTLSGEWQFSEGAGHFTIAAFTALTSSTIFPFQTDTPSSGEWGFCVTHLEGIKDTDPRTPFTSLNTFLEPQRPTWNKARR
jgi:hypothetical protein